MANFCDGDDLANVTSRLDSDGYVFIRNFLPQDEVQEALDFLVENLCQRFPLAPGGPMPKNIGLIRRQDLAAAETVRRVLEHHKIYNLLRRLLGQEVVTPEFKWLRAVGTGQFTGVHSDRVFLQGSDRMLTVWIPLGYTPLEQGALLVVPGSHKLPEFQEIQRTYGSSQVGADGTQSGWLCEDPGQLDKAVGRKVVWRTTHFCSGDIVILDSRVLHMTATNTTKEMRISCDTRWQPRGDRRDPRVSNWHQQFPDEE
ncbi:g2925 [Coccomyxa elongata]